MGTSCSGTPGGRGCGRCRAERAAALAGLLADDCEAHAAGVALLTGAGVGHVRLLAMVARAYGAGTGAARASPPIVRPRWDIEGRRLWLGDRLLKEFRQPAPRQSAILAAFEEQGWDGHIDDPLPPEPGDRPEDGLQRLHDTIHNLNRGLPAGTIAFHGDGTGEGVRWSAYSPAAAGSRRGQRPNSGT